MVEGIYRNKTYFIFLSAIFLMTIVAAVITSLYWITIISFAFLFFYFGWQQAKYIFYLLIFSLPWSIEYNFSSSLGTDLPDELLMWFMTVLFFCWVIFKPTGLAEKYKHPLIISLLVYFGWIIVTVLFSTDWLLSLKFLLAKGWYLIAF